MGFDTTVSLDQGDLYVETSTKRHKLGQRGITSDGRVFRYSHAGEALNIGVLLYSRAPNEWEFATNCPPSTANPAISTTWRYITLYTTWSAFTPPSSTGVTKDLYKDGYIYVSQAANAGQMLRIKSNTTGSTGTAGNAVDFVFHDDDKLTGALTTDNEFVVVHNGYSWLTMNIGEAASGEIGVPKGVTPIAVTSGYYFWLQTWGYAPVRGAGTLVRGEMVAGSTDTNTTGAVSVFAFAGPSTGADIIALVKRPIVGNCVCVGADTEHSLIDLKIAP